MSAVAPEAFRASIRRRSPSCAKRDQVYGVVARGQTELVGESPRDEHTQVASVVDGS